MKTGSGGDAASDAVARSTNGSTVATEVAGALTAFNALSSARAELVFDTIESVGKLSEVGSGKGFEAYVSGPVVTKVVASPISSGNANEVADADTSTGSAAGLNIAVTFDEAMDQNTAPTLTLSDGASSLTLGTGSWNDAKTVFTQPYVVSDKGVDIENITVTVSGALDAGGNPQLLQKAPVAAAPEAEFNIDTLNPDKSTIEIVVADNDQTDADAATSFTVKTTDVDPGTIHVDMRGSEYTALTSIHQSYIQDVTDTIGTAAAGNSPATGLRKLLADGQAVEDAVTHHFGNSGPGKGYADGANALATAIGTAAEGQNAATGLMKVLADGRAVESDQSKLASALSGAVDDAAAVPATSSATITGSLAAQDDKFTVTLRDENGNNQDVTYTAVGPVAATSSATITGSLAAQGDKFTVTLTDENGNTQDLTYTAVGPVAATSSATITGSLAAQGDKFTVTLRDENSNTQDLTYTAVGPVAATSSATITGSLAAQGDKFTVTLRDENSNTQDLTYTAVGPVAATSSATITGSLAAQGDTFEITLTDETNATQVVTMTAGEGGADAAAILTALAGTSSVGGYTFAEVGGALKVTRSDGVDFAISAGAKTGSGDAASDAVARSTNGSTVASENTAADIVTGLAGTSSVGGYTFAERWWCAESYTQ